MASITFVPDEVLDSPLDNIIDNGDLVHLTGEVTSDVTYAQVLALSIGSYAPTITKSDSGTGRKAVLAAKTDVTIDTDANFSGVDKTFNQFIIVDTVNEVIKFIGVGSNKTLSDGDKVNTPSSDITMPSIVLE